MFDIFGRTVAGETERVDEARDTLAAEMAELRALLRRYYTRLREAREARERAEATKRYWEQIEKLRKAGADRIQREKEKRLAGITGADWWTGGDGSGGSGSGGSGSGGDQGQDDPPVVGGGKPRGKFNTYWDGIRAGDREALSRGKQIWYDHMYAGTISKVVTKEAGFQTWGYMVKGTDGVLRFAYGNPRLEVGRRVVVVFTKGGYGRYPVIQVTAPGIL